VTDLQPRDETVSFIQARNCLDQVNNYQLFQKKSYAMGLMMMMKMMIIRFGIAYKKVIWSFLVSFIVPAENIWNRQHIKLWYFKYS